MGTLTDFAKGMIIGFCVGLIVVGLAAGIVTRLKKNEEAIKYAEMQVELQKLREDYANRDPALLLEDPGIRRAADGAAAEFDRKRDEAVQRLRNRLAD